MMSTYASLKRSAKRRKQAARAPNSTLPRSLTPLARTGKPKGVNPARKAREFKRAYGSEERVEWVGQLPCIIGLLCDWSAPRENHHIRGDGTSRKAPARFIVPLCRTHHASIHQIGRASFERFYGIDLAAAAAETEKHWRSHLNGEAT